MKHENKLLSVDVFLISYTLPKFPEPIATFEIEKILNRGTQVFPGSEPTCHLSDVFQCCFKFDQSTPNELAQIRELLGKLEEMGYHWVQIQNVYDF